MLWSWQQFQIRVVDQKDAALISDATPAEGNTQLCQPYYVQEALIIEPVENMHNGLHRTGA